MSIRRAIILGGMLAATVALLPTLAQARDGHHDRHDDRRHGHHDGHHRGGWDGPRGGFGVYLGVPRPYYSAPRAYGPPPVYYAPPQAYYPPPGYYTPPTREYFPPDPYRSPVGNWGGGYRY